MRSEDWMDISTAPKNPEGKFYGPVILVWCASENQPWPAYWGPGGPDNAGCWNIVNDHASRAEDNEIWPSDASHWMPIAAPWDVINAKGAE